jgi:hypothetical protein
MSPIILIHGNNSSAQFFVDEGFIGGLVNKKLLFDNSINMVTSNRVAHGVDLDLFIPPIVASFGVDSVHIVAHSKGGLDTREYLEKFQSNHDSTFKVLSLTTLSTPHNGTVLADMAEARRSALSFAANVRYVNFPLLTPPLELLDEVTGWFQRSDQGAREDLTTSACVGFNGGNVRVLKKQGTTFVTIAGDADLSGNGSIETGEYPGLLIAQPWLADLPALSVTPTINTMYQIVRNMRAITLEYDTKWDFPFFWAYPTVVLIAVPASTPQLNDTLVSVRSGFGEPQLMTLTRRTTE